MVNRKQSAPLLPADNLKDMDPEEITTAIEESRSLSQRGVEDEDAVDQALEHAHQSKDLERVRHGIDLNRP